MKTKSNRRQQQNEINQIKCQAAYEQGHIVARDLLANLAKAIDEMPRKDEIGSNWGYVGGLQEINHRLSELLKFVQS